MSFFHMDGIVYHCERCERWELEKAEGLCEMVQIGDIAVMEQIALNRYYGTQNKYHIRENCVCDDCLGKDAYNTMENARIKVLMAIEEIHDKIIPLYQEYREKILEETLTLAGQLVNEYSFKDDEPELFGKLIKDKNIHDERRLKNLIKSALHGDTLRDAYEKKFIEDIEKNPQIAKWQSEYAEQSEGCLLQRKKLIKALGNKSFVIWQELSGEINLNPHICAETTVVSIGESNKGHKFYCAVEIVPEEIEAQDLGIDVKEMVSSGFYQAGGLGGLRERLAREVREELAKG